MVTNMRSDAENRLLQWCRTAAQHKGFAAYPVMRENVYGAKCGIIDLYQSEPVPGGYDWETRSKTVVLGETWEDCFAKLKEKGAIDD